MYNPFSAQVLIPVIHNIEASFERNPRDIYLVYGNPFCHDEMERTKFKLIKQIKVNLYDPLLNIYKIG